MDIEFLKQFFEYADGKLYWKNDRGRGVKKGNRAGHLQHTGYWIVQLGKKHYREHRIIFMMHHGFLPKEVDHIDGDKLNNNIENLRACSSSENSINKKLDCRNKLKIKNVSFYKQLQKYKVQLCVKGKDIHIGYFDDVNEAATAAHQAREKYFGSFARHQ